MRTILDWIYGNHQMIYIVVLMILVGIGIIGRVPQQLHIHLMSGIIAIHGVIVIGAIIILGKLAPDNYVALTLGFIAVVLGMVNVAGGFVATGRMLHHYHKNEENK